MVIFNAVQVFNPPIPPINMPFAHLLSHYWKHSWKSMPLLPILPPINMHFAHLLSHRWKHSWNSVADSLYRLHRDSFGLLHHFQWTSFKTTHYSWNENETWICHKIQIKCSIPAVRETFFFCETVFLCFCGCGWFVKEPFFDEPLKEIFVHTENTV